MKRKVLFCIENFKHGGIQKSLESLLSQIDRNKYDVSVYAINQEDGPYKSVFESYLCMTQDFWLWAFSTYLSMHSGPKKIWLTLTKSFRKLAIKFGIDPFRLRLKSIASQLSKKQYDTVVAYAEGTVTEFVSHIKAQNKVAWIHIDFKRLLHYDKNNKDYWRSIYDHFDAIVIPSKFSHQSFKDTLPSLSKRAIVVPNIIDVDRILAAAKEKKDIDERFVPSNFTIISVGRVCYEKQYYRIPEVARSLKDKGLDFKWYIIGGGSDAEFRMLLDNVANYEVTDRVIPLGAKDNPYPYIAHSNLLVSTSLSETFSYAINEAKILGVPIVSTDIGSSEEVLSNKHGVICKFEEIAHTISNLMSNHENIESLIINLKNYTYDNNKILVKLQDIL